MTKLYDVLRNGKDISTVAAPKISYAEFSVWHKNKLESPQLATDIKWWRENFTGAPSSNKLLPFAQSQRSTQMGTARRILKATLELPLLKRMKRVCARMDVTPFQFLLAAFRAFVHRYTQEDDLTILMVDGNRPHTELDDVLGFFVNMIPLRCKNDCDTTFDLLLSDIKQTALDALSHSQVPFDTIVDAVQGRAALNHFPLGQVVINYQMYGKPPKYRTSDFDIYAVTVDDIPTACDMALEALEDSNIGLNFRFEYDSYLYDAADMDRFFENFSVFIKSTVRDFRQPISEIEMCGPKELQYLRANYWGADLKPNDWNDQSVWARVAEVAKKQPHSTAIRTSSGETINFQDLLSRAEQVAYSLRQAGALPGQQIGILFHPGIDMISAMMGVTRIRCGYLPLDPEFAKGRLSYMIQDSGARFILIGGGLETPGSELQDSNGFPSLIPISSALSNKGKLNPILSEPADPFYTIYTSVCIPACTTHMITDNEREGQYWEAKGSHALTREHTEHA